MSEMKKRMTETAGMTLTINGKPVSVSEIPVKNTEETESEAK